MSSIAKKRKLRARVQITEESISEDSNSDSELEIDGVVQTEFVPAWAAVAEARKFPRNLEKPVAQELQPQMQPTTQKHKKLTKEQQAAAGPPVWRQDTASCPSCVINSVPGKGRGLVTTRPIKAGQVVVSELPAVHWVYSSWRKSVCAWCMKLADSKSVESEHVLHCDRCSTVHWCSKECAQSHREHGDHGVTCEFLSTVSPQLLQDDDSAAVLNLACGTLALRAKSQDKVERLVLAQSTEVALNASERRAAKTIADLLLGYASSCDDSMMALDNGATSFARAILSVGTDAELWQQADDDDDDDDDIEVGDGDALRARRNVAWWLRQMIRREKSNSFGHRMPPDITPPAKGSGLYPLLAAMNHSCIPNVARARAPEKRSVTNSAPYKLRLEYRALHDLTPGTEILSSYVALTWPQFASSSLAVPKNSAAQQAAEAAQRCPTCNTQLVLRETLRNFTAAPQGYYCDGCSAADPGYRCPKSGCDWDLCAACFNGFVGRGEYLAMEYGFVCDCMRCNLEREVATVSSTEFVEADLEKTGSQSSTEVVGKGTDRGKQIEEFLARHTCDRPGCDDGISIPLLKQPEQYRCNRCGKTQGEKVKEKASEWRSGDGTKLPKGFTGTSGGQTKKKVKKTK